MTVHASVKHKGDSRNVLLDVAAAAASADKKVTFTSPGPGSGQGIPAGVSTRRVLCKQKLSGPDGPLFQRGRTQAWV